MANKKSTTPNRGYRVADQIQRDLSEIIARELKDPRVGMVTIQSVTVTPDYAHANVYFSRLVTGDIDKCVTGLNQAAGFLRKHLFKRLQIHTVPTLHFIYDETTERAAHMSELIAKALATNTRDDDEIAGN
jgi:ribosome-binding factor A